MGQVVVLVHIIAKLVQVAEILIVLHVIVEDIYITELANPAYNIAHLAVTEALVILVKLGITSIQVQVASLVRMRYGDVGLVQAVLSVIVAPVDMTRLGEVAVCSATCLIVLGVQVQTGVAHVTVGIV